MLVQEAVQHGAAAAEGHAEKFNAGETIIHHVANSPVSEPLIHLPTIAGIDFSVTKHVLMLWLGGPVFFVVPSVGGRRVRLRRRAVDGAPLPQARSADPLRPHERARGGGGVHPRRYRPAER